MRIENYEAKSLVRPSYPSTFAWIEYNMNPYQGCWHDCKYCDGKSEGYYMQEDFASVLRVKKNADELLKKFLEKKGYYSQSQEYKQLSFFEQDMVKKDTFTLLIGGGVCDIYQPAEKNLRLTRKCLQIAYDYGIPVILITKSKYILDDLDLLKKINEQTYAAVHITITLADEEIQKIFEPRASTTKERFETLKILRENGIHGGIYSCPVLPFLGDTHDNISALYNIAKQSSAEFLYTSSLTLKPGRNKNEFLATLRKQMPDLLEKYQNLYRNNNPYGGMDMGMAKRYGVKSPEYLFFPYGYELGIPFTAPRYIPKGRIKTNLKLSEILIHAGYLYQYVFHNYQKTKVLYNDAGFLEGLKLDIFQMSDKEIWDMPISDITKSYMNDYKLHGTSNKMDELMNQAYDRYQR